MDEESQGTLKEGEIHPMAQDALRWYKFWQAANFTRYSIMKESIASNAIEGNRLAEVLLDTMNRIDSGDKFSDRYLFGLVWFLRNSVDEDKLKQTQREEQLNGK